MGDSVLESDERRREPDVKEPEEESGLHAVGDCDTKHPSQSVHKRVGGKGSAGDNDGADDAA